MAHSYLSKKLTRPIRIKDGGTLCTILDVRRYMLGFSKNRKLRPQWQRATQLLLAHADVAAVSRQVEAAVAHDGEQDVSGRHENPHTFRPSDRYDVLDAAGEVQEHLAGVEDYILAEAVWREAIARGPGEPPWNGHTELTRLLLFFIRPS